MSRVRDVGPFSNSNSRGELFAAVFLNRTGRRLKVIVCVGAAVALLSGCGKNKLDQKISSAARADMIQYAIAMENLACDCGNDRIAPDNIFGTLNRNPGWLGWKGPYMDGEFPTNDPWLTPYRLVRSGERIQIISAGPDRRFGTEDDIIVVANLPEKGHLPMPHHSLNLP